MARRKYIPKKGQDPGYKPVKLTPRSTNQQAYITSLDRNTVIFATGPAGTGKTHIAIGTAVQMVRSDQVDRIIVTRPLVGVGKDMGFLPGEIGDKVGPYIRPCFDELNYYLSLSMIGAWVREKRIEIVPLSMMRGRSFNEAIVILDEAQNATKAELKTFLTRIGSNSKLVIVGDPMQSDLPDFKRGAFEEAIERLKDIDGIDHVQLTSCDIVRHLLINKVLEKLW